MSIYDDGLYDDGLYDDGHNYELVVISTKNVTFFSFPNKKANEIFTVVNSAAINFHEWVRRSQINCNYFLVVREFRHFDANNFLRLFCDK